MSHNNYGSLRGEKSEASIDTFLLKTDLDLSIKNLFFIKHSIMTCMALWVDMATSELGWLT